MFHLREQNREDPMNSVQFQSKVHNFDLDLQNGSNRKPVYDLLFDEISNFLSISHHSKIFNVEMWMKLILTFKLGQGKI